MSTDPGQASARRERSPEGDLGAIASYYDDYARWYESERRTGYYELINDLEFDYIREAVAGKEVLEVGCGTGLILERTHRAAARARGVDLSREMVEVSRRKGLEAVHAPATELPFDDASFDVVYSFKVLPHVPDIAAALREIVRVLRQDGTAFVEFYNPYSLKALANGVRRLFGRDKGVYVRHDRPSRIREYLPTGVAVVSTRGVRIFAPTRHAYTLPGVRRLFGWLERRFCDSWLGRFGGYFIVELRRV